MTITGLDGVDQLFGIEFLKFLDRTIGADATNLAPTAVSKTFTLTQNQAFTLTEANLLQGTLDADGDALTLQSVYASAHGIVTLTSGNGVRFQVDAGFAGTATFDYVVSDNRGGEARATLAFVVNPTFSFNGTAGEDAFAGLGSADTSHGFDGNDTLDGGFGNDRLLGDAGDDALSGGAGSDQLDGGAGIDTARYQTASAGVAVDLGAGRGTGGEATGDSLTGIENLTGSLFGDTLLGDGQANDLHGLAGDDALAAAAGADRLWGDDGDDRLSGGAGIDTLNGGSGADVLIGGAGADILDGGTGIDVASYAAAAASVTIDLASGAKSGADATGDTYVGIEGVEGSDFADVLTGSAAADRLLGGRGDDAINGAAGADSLTGGLGNDILTGGGGADTYIYTRGDGDDRIIDGYGPSESDKLVLGVGLNAADVILSRSTSDLDDVTLSFRGQAGSIFLDEQFSGPGYGIEQIVFGNGIGWIAADIRAAYIARIQTAGNDTIYGFSGSSTFAMTVLAGDDQIVEGYGPSDADWLVFGVGLNAANLIPGRG
jgi:Ca2+-binding RTX toxin-like protein